MGLQNARLPERELMVQVELELVHSLGTAHELTSRSLLLSPILKGLQPFFEQIASTK